MREPPPGTPVIVVGLSGMLKWIHELWRNRRALALQTGKQPRIPPLRTVIADCDA
jgi:hypothetical protein